VVLGLLSRNILCLRAARGTKMETPLYDQCGNRWGSWCKSGRPAPGGSYADSHTEGVHHAADNESLIADLRMFPWRDSQVDGQHARKEAGGSG